MSEGALNARDCLRSICGSSGTRNTKKEYLFAERKVTHPFVIELKRDIRSTQVALEHTKEEEEEHMRVVEKNARTDKYTYICSCRRVRRVFTSMRLVAGGPLA